MYGEKIEQIKEMLKRGGAVVIAQRGAGKTTALVELLREDERTIVIAPVEAQRRRIFDLYAEKYGEELSHDRVYLDTERSLQNMKGRVNFDYHRVYVEEFYQNKYRGRFHGATGTFPYPVVIV